MDKGRIHFLVTNAKALFSTISFNGECTELSNTMTEAMFLKISVSDSFF